MKVSQMKTSRTMENDGVWKEAPSPWDGVRAKVRRMKSDNVRSKVKEQITPADRIAARNGDSGAEGLEMLTVQITAAACLVELEGVLEEGGEPVENTFERFVLLMKDRELEDFRDWVLLEADTMENYRAAIVEEAVGN